VERAYFNCFPGTILLYPRYKAYFPLHVTNPDQCSKAARKESTVTAKAKTHSPLICKYPFRVQCSIDITRQRPDRFPHKVSLNCTATLFRHKCHKMFRSKSNFKTWVHKYSQTLKFLGATRETGSEFHTDGPQIAGAITGTGRELQVHLPLLEIY